MKAIICDFCKAIIPTDDKRSMSFDVGISASDGFAITTKTEKTIMLDICDGICLACAKKAREAIMGVKRH